MYCLLPKVINLNTRLFKEIFVIRLDHVGPFFTNHINGVLLDTAARNHRDDESVCHTKALDPMDLEFGIDHALVDALGQSSRAASVERSLATIQYGPLHFFVRVEWHRPRVLTHDNTLEAHVLGECLV